MDIPDDIWKCILSSIRFDMIDDNKAKIKHKKLCLVSKLWQEILDNIPYANHMISFNMSINFLRKNISHYLFKYIFTERKVSKEFIEEFKKFD